MMREYAPPCKMLINRIFPGKIQAGTSFPGVETPPGFALREKQPLRAVVPE